MLYVTEELQINMLALFVEIIAKICTVNVCKYSANVE